MPRTLLESFCYIDCTLLSDFRRHSFNTNDHAVHLFTSPAKSTITIMATAPTLPHPDVYDHKKYFFTHLGLSERLLEHCLGEALSAGGDFADLYFEAVISTSLGMDEGIIKTASQGISVGCGVRVLSGERTGFAHTDDLSSERLLKAART